MSPLARNAVRTVRILAPLAVILIWLAYALRWDYGPPGGIVQTRTNRWTGTTECLPSYPLLWTQLIKDKSGFTKTGRTGGPCSSPDEAGEGDWVCKPHRKAAWGRCGE